VEAGPTRERQRRGGERGRGAAAGATGEADCGSYRPPPLSRDIDGMATAATDANCDGFFGGPSLEVEI
jgi:hypothetical protein